VIGNPEVTGNRVFKEALEKYEPKENPLPEPVLPDPTTTATTPEAAQAEFLRAHELEQSAQDAAAGRNVEAEKLRGQNVDTQKAVAQTEATRAIEGEQSAQDLAAARAKFAASKRAENSTADQTRRLPEGQALREGGRANVAATQASSPPAVTPTEAPAQPTIQDKEVVPADPERGVQPVTLPVEVPPKPSDEGMERKSSSPNQPTHPAGEVTAFDETTGLPIVRRGGGETKSAAPETKPAEAETETPDSHIFSKADFAAANPGGDVAAAAKAAQEAGFEVQD